MKNKEKKILLKTKKRILKNYKNCLDNLTEVYIFGGKTLGIHLLRYFLSKKIIVKGFIDNNKNINGNKIQNTEIFLPSQIKDKDTCVIIASISYMFEINRQLQKYGFKNIIPFSFLTVYYPELNKFSQSYNGLYSDYIKNKNEYKKLYKILNDKISKDTLNGLIKYRKSYDTMLFNTISQGMKNQYFEKFLSNNYDIFIDGGGYNGDTVLRFIKFNQNYKKIYFFEPDLKSFNEAKKNLIKYSNIEFHNKGIANRKKILHFNANYSLGSMFSKDKGSNNVCLLPLN